MKASRIAVLVDGSHGDDEENDKGEEQQVYTPRSAEEMAKFETLVKR